MSVLATEFDVVDSFAQRLRHG